MIYFDEESGEFRRRYSLLNPYSRFLNRRSNAEIERRRRRWLRRQKPEAKRWMPLCLAIFYAKKHYLLWHP